MKKFLQARPKPPSAILAAMVAATIATGAYATTPESALAELPAGAYVLDVEHSHIHWAISHVGYSMTRGRFNEFEGEVVLDPAELGASTAEIVVKAASIDVNHRGLEEELRAEWFLDAAGHPEIRFAFTGFDLATGETGTLTGDLTMKGVTRPITLDVTLNRVLARPKNPAFTRMGFSATGVLDRRDWGVDAVEMVAADVTLYLEAEFLLDVEQDGLEAK